MTTKVIIKNDSDVQRSDSHIVNIKADGIQVHSVLPGNSIELYIWQGQTYTIEEAQEVKDSN